MAYDINPAGLRREHFAYAACFCEENIWQLGKSLVAQGISIAAMHAVVLSNANRTIALLQQRAAPPGQAMMWDYHVILLLKNADEEWILDFDTRLPFATLRHDYALNSFIPAPQLAQEFQPLLRVIPMTEYLARFASDRRHMRDENGEPLQPFPLWPAIQPSDVDQPITLMQYMEMEGNLPGNSRVYSQTHWLEAR